MKDRVLKRRASRKNQSIRRDLVHAAGCTESNCAAKSWFLDAKILEEVRGGTPISVPRSLRPTIGRWL